MKNKEPALNIHEYVSDIKKQPEFKAAYENKSPEEELQVTRRRALALGARAAGDFFRVELGEHAIKPRVMDMISLMGDYYDSQSRLDTYHQKYSGGQRAPHGEYLRSLTDKSRVIEFNHSLNEVIEASGNRLSFNDLLKFMTELHVGVNGQEGAQQFHDRAREALVGMRNEIATEAVLLQYGDYDIEMASAEQDALGGDIIIDGVPFDVKASQATADRAREKAVQYGRDPNLIVWSHIDFEDFEGRLTLPQEHFPKVARGLLPDIEAGLYSQGRRRRIRAI